MPPHISAAASWRSAGGFCSCPSSCPTPPAFLTSRPPVFGRQCPSLSLRAAQPPGCVSIRKRSHFSCGHGPLPLPPPNIPPRFPSRSSRVRWGGVAHRESSSLSVCPPGGSLPSVSSPRAPSGSSKMTRLSQTQGLLRPFPPGQPPSPRGLQPPVTQGPRPSSGKVFGKALIIYGDFSPCPAAALRGRSTKHCLFPR